MANAGRLQPCGRRLQPPVFCFPRGYQNSVSEIATVELPYHSRFALSGVQVFGLDKVTLLNRVESGRVECTYPLTCLLKWSPAKGIVGYNV